LSLLHCIEGEQVETNPVNERKEIIIGGRTFHLRYQHRDLATAEYLLKKQGWDIPLLGPGARHFWTELGQLLCSECGTTLPEVEQPDAKIKCPSCHRKVEAAGTVDQFKVGVLLYVGLIHEDRTLTFEAAQDLITFQNMAEVTAEVMGFAVQSMMPVVKRPTPEAEAEEKQDPLPGNPRPSGSGGPTGAPLVDSTLDSLSENSGGSPLPNSTLFSTDTK
jgi:hypothetical protein